MVPGGDRPAAPLDGGDSDPKAHGEDAHPGASEEHGSSLSFLAQVEQAYLSRAKRGMALSSRDVQLAVRWQSRGVPAHVVARGIEQAFDARESTEPPRSLRFASRAVEQAIKAYVRTHPGAGSPQPASGAAVAPAAPLPPASQSAYDLARQRLEAALPGTEDPRACEVLAAHSSALAAAPEREVDEPPYEVWERTRLGVLASLAERLTEQERRDLRRSARASVRAIMTADAALAHEAATFDRLLAGHFGLTRLLA